MRQSKVYLALIGLICSTFGQGQGLASGPATVHITASLAPHVELQTISTTACHTVPVASHYRLRLKLQPQSRPEVLLSFRTNTRSAHIWAFADAPNVVVAVEPSTGDCNWVHASAAVGQTGRVIAAAAHCTPMKEQTLRVSLRNDAQASTVELAIEPQVNGG
jgi:hypothetical protein